jgi:Leucine-rich repeat (LRR) protein
MPFRTLATLQSLDLSSNDIVHMADGCLWGLAQLRTLTLAHNRLTRIDKSWLYGLRALREMCVH